MPTLINIGTYLGLNSKPCYESLTLGEDKSAEDETIWETSFDCISLSMENFHERGPRGLRLPTPTA